MANVQKLVIPKGLINPKETTIVEIPAELQSVGTVVATPKVEFPPSTQRAVANRRRGSKTHPRPARGGKDYFDNQTYGGHVMESTVESSSTSRTHSRQSMSPMTSSDSSPGFAPMRAPSRQRTPESLNYADIFGSNPHSPSSPGAYRPRDISYHGDLSPIPPAGDYSFEFDPFYTSSAVKRDGPPSPQFQPPVDHRSMSLPKCLDSSNETMDYFVPPLKSTHRYENKYDNSGSEFQIDDTNTDGFNQLSHTPQSGSGGGGSPCSPCQECSGEMEESYEESGGGDLLDSLEELEQQELSSILNDTRSFHCARRRLILDASGLSSAEEYVSGYLSSGGGNSSGASPMSTPSSGRGGADSSGAANSSGRSGCSCM